MARHRRRVQPADLPGFSQTPLTRRTVIAGAGAAIAAVGTRGLFGPLSTAWCGATTRSTPLAAYRYSTQASPTCAGVARCQPRSRSSGGGSFRVSGAPTSPRNAARLIDTKLAIPLLNLPPTVLKDPMVSLAQRNLIRGKRLGLPAGQDVAKLMKMKPLSASELGLPDPAIPAGLARHRCGTTSCARRRSASKVADSARWAPSSSLKSSSASLAVTSPPTSMTRPRSSPHHQSPRAVNSPWGSSQPSRRAPRPQELANDPTDRKLTSGWSS